MKRHFITFFLWSLLAIAVGVIASISLGGGDATTAIGQICHYLDISLFVLFGVISAAIIAFSVAR